MSDKCRAIFLTIYLCHFNQNKPSIRTSAWLWQIYIYRKYFITKSSNCRRTRSIQNLQSYNRIIHYIKKKKLWSGNEMSLIILIDAVVCGHKITHIHELSSSIARDAPSANFYVCTYERACECARVSVCMCVETLVCVNLMIVLQNCEWWAVCVVRMPASQTVLFVRLTSIFARENR